MADSQGPFLLSAGHQYLVEMNRTMIYVEYPLFERHLFLRRIAAETVALQTYTYFLTFLNLC